MTTDSRQRVRATWNTRRSSSMSVLKRWGNTPWVASWTTTWGHSRPFTRCTVDNCTPSGSRPEARIGPSQASNVVGSGWSRPRAMMARRSSEWAVLFRPRWAASRVSIALSSPMSPRTKVRSSAVVDEAASRRMRSTSAQKPRTFSASRSLIRPARRRSPAWSVCSAIHSTTLGERPRPGRRAARWTSPGRNPAPVAILSHESAAATPVRWTNPVPSRLSTPIPSESSAACTGASRAFTRVSTTMSVGVTPPSTRC